MQLLRVRRILLELLALHVRGQVELRGVGVVRLFGACARVRLFLLIDERRGRRVVHFARRGRRGRGRGR